MAIRNCFLFLFLFIAGAMPASPVAVPLELTGHASGFVQTISCPVGENVVGASALLQFPSSIFGGLMPLCGSTEGGAAHGAMGQSTTWYRGLGTLHTRYENVDKTIRPTRTVLCPARTQVSGYQAIAGDDEAGIGMVRLDCTGGGVTTVVELAAESVPASPRKGKHFACPAGQMASGFIGRSGSWLQAIGLVCGEPDAAQLAIQNANDKTFDTMEAKRVAFAKDNLVQGEYKWFRYGDGSMSYDYATGKVSGFWEVSFHWENEYHQVKDPESGGVISSTNVDTLHGLADASGKLIGKPNYLTGIDILSPYVARVTTRKNYWTLLTLQSGEERQIPSAHAYSVVMNSQPTLLLANGTLGDPGGTTLTFLKQDGTPGRSYDHVVGFGNRTLWAQLNQAAPGEAKKTLWVNLDQTLGGTTPETTVLAGFGDLPQTGAILGASPAGWGKVMDPRLYQMMSVSGLPHSQPAEVLAVAPFVQPEMKKSGWVFVSRKGNELEYRVSLKATYEDAVLDYSRLFPFQELGEAKTNETLAGAVATYTAYKAPVIVGRVSADDWVAVTDEMGGWTNSREDIASAAYTRHAKDPQMAVDSFVLAQNAQSVKMAASQVEETLKLDPQRYQALAQTLLDSAILAGGELPAHVATSNWAITVGFLPLGLAKLCAQPSVKNCTQLRQSVEYAQMQNRARECKWNPRLCMNAEQIKVADAKLEETMRRGTALQQWERAVSAYERDSTARINASADGMLKTQERINRENCAAAAQGRNRNCDIR